MAAFERVQGRAHRGLRARQPPAPDRAPRDAVDRQVQLRRRRPRRLDPRPAQLREQRLQGLSRGPAPELAGRPVPDRGPDHRVGRQPCRSRTVERRRERRTATETARRRASAGRSSSASRRWADRSRRRRARLALCGAETASARPRAWWPPESGHPRVSRRPRRAPRTRGPRRRGGPPSCRAPSAGAMQSAAADERGADREDIADEADRRPAGPLADRVGLIRDREHGGPHTRLLDVAVEPRREDRPRDVAREADREVGDERRARTRREPEARARSTRREASSQKSVLAIVSRPARSMSLAERMRDGDREQDRAGAEDTEPDDGIEAAERRQADVAKEVRLPETVVALAPHARERGDAEDREQRGPGPDEARALAGRCAPSGRTSPAPRAAAARTPSRASSARRRREQDRAGSRDDDRQAQVDDGERRHSRRCRRARRCGRPGRRAGRRPASRSWPTSSASQASNAPLVNV